MNPLQFSNPGSKIHAVMMDMFETDGIRVDIPKLSMNPPFIVVTISPLILLELSFRLFDRCKCGQWTIGYSGWILPKARDHPFIELLMYIRLP